MTLDTGFLGFNIDEALVTLKDKYQALIFNITRHQLELEVAAKIIIVKFYHTGSNFRPEERLASCIHNYTYFKGERIEYKRKKENIV